MSNDRCLLYMYLHVYQRLSSPLQFVQFACLVRFPSVVLLRDLRPDMGILNFHSCILRILYK